MEQTNEFDTYEKQMGKEEDILNTDVNINPDYYIHISIVNAINALKSDGSITSFKDRAMQFVIMINTLETLAIASKRLTATNKDKENLYEANIECFKKEGNYQNANDTEKLLLLANHKLRLIVTELNENRTSNAHIVY